MSNTKVTGGGVLLRKDASSEKKNWKLVNFCEFDKYAIKSYCAIHDVDESLNLGDITKVDETKLDDFNMIVGGSPCFVAGTHVLSKQGYKNIEELKVGDFVYTKEGRWKQVKNVGSDGEKEVLKIRATGILPIECTLNHPFWIKHKNKIKNDDAHGYKYYLSNAEKVYANDLTKNDFIGVPIISDRLNKLANISDELLWLLGRYVADGHISDKGVILSIGYEKIDKFDNIKSYHKTYEHTKSCYRVIFNKSSELYDIILRYNFGQGAINKDIPVEILELPRERLKVFLEGYWSGDGCHIKDTNVYQATTISRKLAESLVLAIQKVFRTGCKVYFNERPSTHEIEGRVVNQNDTYMVRFLSESQKSSFFVEDDFVWYPIKEIRKDGLRKVIYNIEVSDDHTYIANGASVFNCQDFSLAGKQKGSVWTCKDCGHEYNPLTVHWSERDKCPNCGSSNIDKTRSSLLIEFLRIIRAAKPNFGVYENVKNIVGKQFKETTFKLFEDELHEYGYCTHWKVLNSKDFGVPQNRERVYLIFIKKELDNGKFVFPEGFDNGIRLKDVLEDTVDEKYYISDDKVQRFLTNLNSKDAILYDHHQAYREGKSREYNDFSPTLNQRDYKEPRLINENAVKQVGNISDIGSWDNPQAGRIYSSDGCSPTLNTCGGGGHEPKIVQVGKINSSQDGVVVDEDAISPTCTGGRNKTPKVMKVGNINPSQNGMGGNVYSDNGLSPTITINKGEGSKIIQNLDKNEITDGIVHFCDDGKTALVKQPTKKGFVECEVGSVADLSYPTSQSRCGRVQDGGKCSPTIPTHHELYRLESEIRIRKLTPKECFRLMGFDDSDYEAAAYVRKQYDWSDLLYNAKLKDAKEKLSQKDMEIYASCIIKDILEQVGTSVDLTKYQNMQETEKIQNVNIAIIRSEELERLGCVTSTIKCSGFTVMLYGQTIKNDQLHHTAIIELVKTHKENTGKYMRITSEENLSPMKLSIILMVLKLITESKIYTSTLQEVNICQLTHNLTSCENNTEKMQISDLKMECMYTRVSASQLYKQAGNSIVVDVLYYIYVELYKAMPYLFDDLKLGSFFSGVGAFESGLDRLYESINTGNFTQPQID